MGSPKLGMKERERESVCLCERERERERRRSKEGEIILDRRESLDEKSGLLCVLV